MMRKLWARMFPPPPKKELIALGRTEWHYIGQQNKHFVDWFFYRQGEERLIEWQPVGANPENYAETEKTAHKIWEQQIRMWVECNHLPKWADPVVARIIADSAP